MKLTLMIRNQDRESRLRVIYSHPARQQNVPERPARASQLGLDVTFLTGLYYKPDQFPYSALRWTPSAMRSRLHKRLMLRRYSAIPDARVVSVSGVIPEVICRPQGWNRLWSKIHDHCAARWLSKIPLANSASPTIFHGFQGSCARSLRVAKDRGFTTVLEITQPLNTSELVVSERLRLGLPAKYDGPNSEDLIEISEADFLLIQSPWSSSGLEDRSQSTKLLVPLGVDTELFHPDAEKHDGRIRFLFTGQLCIRKGIHHLIEAWSQTNASNAELLLIGMPTDEIGRQITERCVSRVTWLPHQTHERLAEIYRSSDVFVGPSLSEAGFNSVYEAAASGLPCIVSDHAGSLIRDGIDGFVVPAGDVSSLSARIRQLLIDSCLRQDQGKSARLRAEEFSWSRFGERLICAYRQILQLASAPPGIRPKVVSLI